MIINDQPPTKTNTELLLSSEEDQEVDFSPLIGYLQSPQGHEIASRVVAKSMGSDSIDFAIVNHAENTEARLDKLFSSHTSDGLSGIICRTVSA